MRSETIVMGILALIVGAAIGAVFVWAMMVKAIKKTHW